MHRADSSAICPGELDGSLELGCVRSRGATGKIAPLLASHTVFNALKPVRALHSTHDSISRHASISASSAASTSTSSTSPPPPFASFEAPGAAVFGFGFRFGFGFFGLSADGAPSARPASSSERPTPFAPFVTGVRPPASSPRRASRLHPATTTGILRVPSLSSSSSPSSSRSDGWQSPDARARRLGRRSASRSAGSHSAPSASMRSDTSRVVPPASYANTTTSAWRATPRRCGTSDASGGHETGTVPFAPPPPPLDGAHPGVSSNITARSSSSSGPATCAGIVAGGAVLRAFRPQPSE